MVNKSGDVLLLSNGNKEDKISHELLEKQREDLISMIIHDLKNPLQAQISGLELLAKGTFGLLNHSQREIIEMTINSAVYMQGLIYDILLASKAENGGLVLSFERFDIEDLINQVIKENRYMADDKSIKISFLSKLTIKTKEIRADKRILRRVIENLINNSINYANKASEIKIEISKKTDMFEFNIGSESPEIAHEISAKIFEKYNNGSLYGKIGNGLGLYFCKLALNAHQGSIELKSGKNYNVFTFKIPY